MIIMTVYLPPAKARKDDQGSNSTYFAAQSRLWRDWAFGACGGKEQPRSPAATILTNRFIKARSFDSILSLLQKRNHE